MKATQPKKLRKGYDSLFLITGLVVCGFAAIIETEWPDARLNHWGFSMVR
jgi:hypothetical protein